MPDVWIKSGLDPKFADPSTEVHVTILDWGGRRWSCTSCAATQPVTPTLRRHDWESASSWHEQVAAFHALHPSSLSPGAPLPAPAAG